MKKLGKRKIIAATGVLAATAVIGVPAAIVYTSKDTRTKSEIGINVEREIESRVFDSLNFLPTTQFGKFKTDMIEEHVKGLSGLKFNVDEKLKEFNLRSKSRMPIYGILNDAFNASERFYSWGEFSKRVQDVIKDINSSNWDKLEEDLFDIKGNGAKKLLSESYGVDREDIKSIQTDDSAGMKVSDKNEIERKKYGMENTFISFGEYIKNIKNGIHPEFKDSYISSIVSALNMMTGTPITYDGSKELQVELVDKTPTNSIVYMALQIEDKTKVDQYNAVGDIWQNQVLPAWNDRYRALDQFFNAEHEPLGINGNYNDKTETDIFNIYDERYFEKNKGETIQSSIETFLEGKQMPGKEPNYNPLGIGAIGGTDASTTPSSISKTTFEGTTGRYLTNIEFMRVLFGTAFNKLSSNAKRQSSTEQKGFSWDWVLSSNSTDIEGKDGAKNTTIQLADYFDQSIQNIFKGANTNLQRIVKRYDKPNDKTSNLNTEIEEATVYDALTQDLDFQDSYDALVTAQETYDNEINKIHNDSFSIGINLEKFNNVIKSFKLDSNWEIRIDSMLGKVIDSDKIKKLVSELKYQNDKKTLMTHTDFYDIYNGYIYPNVEKDDTWLLRSSNSLSIRNLGFENGAKLAQFGKQLSEIRIFKPSFMIDESKDVPAIFVNLNVIDILKEGGSND